MQAVSLTDCRFFMPFAIEIASFGNATAPVSCGAVMGCPATGRRAPALRRRCSVRGGRSRLCAEHQAVCGAHSRPSPRRLPPRRPCPFGAPLRARRRCAAPLACCLRFARCAAAPPCRGGCAALAVAPPAPAQGRGCAAPCVALRAGAFWGLARARCGARVTGAAAPSNPCLPAAAAPRRRSAGLAYAHKRYGLTPPVLPLHEKTIRRTPSGVPPN